MITEQNNLHCFLKNAGNSCTVQWGILLLIDFLGKKQDITNLSGFTYKQCHICVIISWY